MNDARQVFGSTLRTHREQLGITLSEIADATKISMGLLDALERSDLSRWPKGIFRRAFFREYVVAIGLPPEPLLNEFGRLFPDEPGAPAVVEAPTDFRLALAAPERAATAVASKRAAVVVCELSAIALAGAVAAWALDATLWSAAGGIALAYYPVSNLCVDRIPAIRSLRILVNAQIPPSTAQPRKYEEIEAHEELQVSY